MDTLNTTNLEQICEENRGFVHWIINTYFPRYSCDEDFFQEAWIGLWEAIKDFDENRGAKFHTFAKIVIKRRCCDELRRRRRHEKFPTVSIDGGISDMDLTYLDILPDRTDVAGTVVSEVFAEQLMNAVSNSGLSDKQLNIMTCRLQGQTLVQISKSVGMCTSKVSVGMRTIKQTFKVMTEIQ